MIAILGLVSTIGIFVSLFMLVVSLIKKGNKKKWLLNMGICLAVFIVTVSLPTDGSQSPNSSSSPKSSEAAVELTDEEKAQSRLEDATSEFADGDYMSAIDICEEIKETYPNTKTTNSMDAYLQEQYGTFPEYTAKALMSEYEANVVNADKEYNDVVMVVTGTVSSIGKTNGDRNLTVILNSGTYFSGVQLNFKTSQEDAVAALREGDTVKALGKCTGQSGTVLLVIDGKNVMIENCVIIP